MGIIVAGLTISAFYQTIDHLTIFGLYSAIAIGIGVVTHLQYYTDYKPEIVVEE